MHSGAAERRRYFSTSRETAEAAFKAVTTKPAELPSSGRTSLEIRAAAFHSPKREPRPDSQGRGLGNPRSSAAIAPLHGDEPCRLEGAFSRCYAPLPLNSTSAASLVPPSLHASAQRGLSYSDAKEVDVKLPRRLGETRLTDLIDDRRFAETIYRVALADGIMDRVTYQDPPEDAS